MARTGRNADLVELKARDKTAPSSTFTSADSAPRGDSSTGPGVVSEGLPMVHTMHVCSGLCYKTCTQLRNIIHVKCARTEWRKEEDVNCWLHNIAAMLRSSIHLCCSIRRDSKTAAQQVRESKGQGGFIHQQKKERRRKELLWRGTVLPTLYRSTNLHRHTVHTINITTYRPIVTEWNQ